MLIINPYLFTERVKVPSSYLDLIIPESMGVYGGHGDVCVGGARLFHRRAERVGPVVA